MNKKILFFLLIITVIIIGIVFIFLYSAKDELPSLDNDLRLSILELSKEDNAYYVLEESIKKLYLPNDKIKLLDEIVQGDKWDEDFINELLTQNKETLFLFDRACALSKFQDPEYIDPEKVHAATPVANLGDYRKIAKINLVRTLHLFKQGKNSEAFDETIKIIKFGQMIEESQGSLIHYLVGMAIKKIGLNNLRIMIKDTALTSEALKDYAKELDKYKASKEGLKNALKMEYATTTNSLLMLKTEEVIQGVIFSQAIFDSAKETEIPLGLRIATKFPYFYKPNKTKRIIADSYRELINNVDKNYGEISEIKRLVPSNLFSLKILLTENIIGRMLHDIVVVALDGIYFRRCEEDFSVIGTQVLFALRDYQIEKRQLPSSLNDLVPEYFSEIPRDSCDGQPVRFSIDKKIIYSIGSDLKDSGGSEDDIVYKIEF